MEPILTPWGRQFRRERRQRIKAAIRANWRRVLLGCWLIGLITLSWAAVDEMPGLVQYLRTPTDEYCTVPTAAYIMALCKWLVLGLVGWISARRIF